jgi:hypothetical protein
MYIFLQVQCHAFPVWPPVLPPNLTYNLLVGFEVLTAVNKKMAVIRAMMEAARTSETLVNFYQTTRR